MKIGKRVKAKKYAPLREKQKLANAMLTEAKGRLKEDHRSIKTTKAKIKTFYHKRGLKQPSRLSFKSLSTKDLKAYEQLLDSIINDTFINKSKYEKFRGKMRDNFEEQFGQGFSDDEMDDFINIFEHPVVKDLLNLGMTPSELQTVLMTYYEAGLSDKDFLLMLTEFSQDFGEDILVDDFFIYADKWARSYSSWKSWGTNSGFGSWEEFKEENFGSDLL